MSRWKWHNREDVYGLFMCRPRPPFQLLLAAMFEAFYRAIKRSKSVRFKRWLVFNMFTGTGRLLVVALCFQIAYCTQYRPMDVLTMPRLLMWRLNRYCVCCVCCTQTYSCPIIPANTACSYNLLDRGEGWPGDYLDIRGISVAHVFL